MLLICNHYHKSEDGHQAIASKERMKKTWNRTGNLLLDTVNVCMYQASGGAVPVRNPILPKQTQCSDRHEGISWVQHPKESSCSVILVLNLLFSGPHVKEPHSGLNQRYRHPGGAKDHLVTTLDQGLRTLAQSVSPGVLQPVSKWGLFMIYVLSGNS